MNKMKGSKQKKGSANQADLKTTIFYRRIRRKAPFALRFFFALRISFYLDFEKSISVE